jgi:alkylresorcinol/alkylpyrone synthase/polyketide synthase Type III
MARILGIGTAVPPLAYTQDEVYRISGYTRRIIQSVFRNAAIDRRKLALPPGHRPTRDPDWFARHYEEWAIRLGSQAASSALHAAGLNASDVDYLVATSCTGYLCPGVSQWLARELGLSPRARTANLVGMGCNAVVPALERAAEFARLHPGAKTLVVATEICSATYWIDEQDLETAVGNAIFADGASAAVIAHETEGTKAGLSLEGFASRADRELIRYMGFHNQEGRLRVMLSRDVPEAVLPLTEGAIDDLLGAAGLKRRDVARWIVHPGGRRVLELIEERLGLKGALEPSWRVLAEYGNMSSATLLFVLQESLRESAAPGPTVMVGMGPGLSVETALLSARG